MIRDLTCRTCIHKKVCEHRNTLEHLQNELLDGLDHTYFKVGSQYDSTLKLKDFDFIRSIKIECTHYLQDTSIMES